MAEEWQEIIRAQKYASSIYYFAFLFHLNVFHSFSCMDFLQRFPLLLVSKKWPFSRTSFALQWPSAHITAKRWTGAGTLLRAWTGATAPCTACAPPLSLPLPHLPWPSHSCSSSFWRCPFPPSTDVLPLNTRWIETLVLCWLSPSCSPLGAGPWLKISVSKHRAKENLFGYCNCKNLHVNASYCTCLQLLICASRKTETSAVRE